jgi:hypothetical protein
MGKIQENGPQPRQRARLGVRRPQTGPAAYRGSGTVVAAQQRSWVPPRAPSFAVQADAAARQRGLSTYSVEQQKELQAAHAVLSEGSKIPSLLPALLGAMASPLLRAELDGIARDKSASETGTDPSAQQQPIAELTERDFVVLHVRPSLSQGASLDDRSCALFKASTKRSTTPAEVAAAVQAAHDLNEAVLDKVATEGAPAAEGKAAALRVALKAALTHCVIHRDGGVPEVTMRCKCLLSAVTGSGLLQPGQKRATVVLDGGLALDVSRQPDPWEKVVVLVQGLSPAISPAQAAYMVADVLKGAPFELSTGSQPRRAVDGPPSGRELMGITIASERFEEHQATQGCERTLCLTVRRDKVSRLPPVMSVLSVTPMTADSAAHHELTWVRFVVDPRDGHTDARRCCNCGDVGHAAPACTAQSNGHFARFTWLAAVPSSQTAARGRRPTNTTKAAASKQQQPTLDTDGFTAVSANRRAVHQQLSQQATRQPRAIAPTSDPVTANTDETVTPRQPAASAEVSARTTVTHRAAQEPTEAEVLAESEHMEQVRRQKQLLNDQHATLALCLTPDGTVGQDHTEQFANLLAEHRAHVAAASDAHARAVEAETAATTASPLTSPKGKSRASAQGNKVYQQQVQAYLKAKTQRTTQLKAAQKHVARTLALLTPMQSFARKLQQCVDASQFVDAPRQHSDTQLQPADVDASLEQLTTDSCDSLSPVIDLPADSQVASTAVTAQPLEVGSAVAVAAAAAASAEAVMRAAVQLQPPSVSSETRAAELEQHRDAVRSANLTDFDQAEEAGVRTEQARLLQVAASRAAAVSPVPGTAKQGTFENLGESETERSIGHHSDSESCDSGPSESSESECSDAGASQSVTVRRRGQQQQQQLQHQPAASAQTLASSPGSTPTPRVVRKSTKLATEAAKARTLAAESAAKAAAASQALSSQK